MYKQSGEKSLTPEFLLSPEMPNIRKMFTKILPVNFCDVLDLWIGSFPTTPGGAGCGGECGSRCYNPDN